MIDLSIPKNPEWRAERGALWKKHERDIKGDYIKKEVEAFKVMFMDGEFQSFKYYI